MARCNHKRWGGLASWLPWLPWLLLLWLMAFPAQAREFGAYSVEVTPAEVFPGADRFGPWEGDPPKMVAFQGKTPVGYLFRTRDIGYSGKPIEMVVGMALDGTIVGAKVAKHYEPILLVGIPEQKLFDFVSRRVGRNLVAERRASTGEMALDAISGATVTAIVIHDGLTRGSMRILDDSAQGGASEQQKFKQVEVPFQPASWETLLNEGSLGRLHLTRRDVDAAFAKVGVGSGEPYIKVEPPEHEFIDLYAALVTPEAIGRNLLGMVEYTNFKEWMAPAHDALLIVARGSYSFRGSGFVRGAIFDRFKLVQDGASFLFRDKHYHRLGSLGEGMPEFPEIGLFKIPEEAHFDPSRPWRLELLVQRPTGPIEKVYTSFSLNYTLPPRFLAPVATSVESPTPVSVKPEATTGALWQRIWWNHWGDLVVLGVCLSVLTLIFFFQDSLVAYPTLLNRLRLGFLLFSLVWLGGYAKAQLSVVNVFTFSHALTDGFRWDFFLLEPLIFVLWCSTAMALLLWGRGTYCGWLCPFGALLEWLNWLARRLHIPQVRIPFALHERLWAIKYILFLGLFGVSLQSLATAEWLAEIEPFKTVVLLRFDREWPYVAWAVAILASGLFVERFYCRYLCPLGAALAIPGRMRIFAWLKRRRHCGELCSNCSDVCLVQSIMPHGEIHPNECLYCLRCQMNYVNDQVCPVLIMRRTRKERRAKGGQAPAAVVVETYDHEIPPARQDS